LENVPKSGARRRKKTTIVFGESVRDSAWDWSLEKRRFSNSLLLKFERRWRLHLHSLYRKRRKE
jgi:hypothetical protein